MPELLVRLGAPWDGGAALHGGLTSVPWENGQTLHSLGGTYTPPPAPPGGTPAVPNTTARFVMAAADSVVQVHAPEVLDLRDGLPVEVSSGTITADAANVFWALQADCPESAYAKLSAGDQPPTVRVTLAPGQVWEFVVESVTRQRTFAASRVAITGRSITCAAGSPYQPEQAWRIDGDTTAAQIAATANVYTQLELVWAVQDWPVPDGVFNYTGTPLGVVKRVADAVDAVVQSDRSAYQVQVLPRYPVLPNEWGTVPPDVEVELGAVASEGFQSRKQPAYDGVFLFGQQQGAAALVRLAGTSGANLHPSITDALLTDDAACAQRGAAVLGNSGDQQDHTLRLPVLTGAGEPGVFELNWLARIVEPTVTWYGLVRRVQCQFGFGNLAQIVELERRTNLVVGTVLPPALPPPLLFTGPISDISVAPGGAVSLDLSLFYSQGVTPYRYSLRSGTLPAWLSVDETTGMVSGTAPGSPAPATPLQFRAEDAINGTDDTNVLNLTVTAPAATDVVLFRFNGTNGQTTGITNEGTGTGTFSLQSFDGTWGLSTTTPVYGSAWMRLDASGAIFEEALIQAIPGTTARPAASGQAFTMRVWARCQTTTSGRNLLLQWVFWNGPASSSVYFLMTDNGSTITVTAVSRTTDGLGGLSEIPIGGTTTVARNTTCHLQLSVGADGTGRFFVNGTQVGGTTSLAGRLSGSSGGVPVLLARAGNRGIGWFDDWNCRLGYADTANFTPPGAL